VAEIDVGGRPWSLSFTALPAFHDKFGSKLPMLFFIRRLPAEFSCSTA